MSKETNDAWVNAHYGYDAHPIVDNNPAAAPVADTRLANWIIAAVGDIPYSTMTSGQVIDALRTNRHVYEGNEGCGTYYNGGNTPAAPGIDLEQFRPAVVEWRKQSAATLKQLQSGFTPLGGSSEELMQSRVAKADELLTQIDASPKRGSMSDCPIIRLAPGEYTDWEKRVWRRGVIEAVTQPDIALAVNMSALIER